MTLATICTAALQEIGGFDVPSSFYGNSNLTATQCVALANRAGRTLEKDVRWAELLTEHTFNTSSGTATYALPSDFRAFANMSQWDRTNNWRMAGPMPSMVYQWLQGGATVASGMNKWFMIRGAYFTIYPTPTATEEIAFDYYSKAWITKQADSSNVSAWTSDNDTARVDEDLLTLSLKWRFLQAKGMPYEPEYREYEAIVDSLREDNGGRRMISLNSRYRNYSDGLLPEEGFGGGGAGQGEEFLVDD